MSLINPLAGSLFGLVSFVLGTDYRECLKTSQVVSDVFCLPNNYRKEVPPTSTYILHRMKNLFNLHKNVWRKGKASLPQIGKIHQSIYNNKAKCSLIIGSFKRTSDIKLLNKKIAKNKYLLDILFFTFDTCSLQPTFYSITVLLFKYLCWYWRKHIYD